MARASSEAAASNLLLGLAVCTVLVACGMSTRQHVAHFRDSEALWEYELARNPANLHALELVATAQLGKDPERSLGLFQRGHDEAAGHCNPALAGRFALLSTKQLVGSSADTDQAQLLALGAFYDLAEREHRLELRGREISLIVDLPDRYAAQLLGNASLFGIPQAAVAMRTMDLSRAEELARRVLEADPDNDSAWLLLARIQARGGRFEDARESLEFARRRAPENGAISAFGRALRQAEYVASGPAENERQKRLRDAQINVVLGAPEAARRALQPELDRSPGDPTIVLAYVRTMVADGRIDLAEYVISNAEEAAPENAEKWTRLKAALPKH